MIKRGLFVCGIIAMLCGTQEASAQDVSARISGLEDNGEYMGLLRNDALLRNREDSLIGVIRSVRGAMAENAATRDSLAQVRSDSLLLMLSDAENAVFSLRMEKLKLVDRINAIEQNFVLSNMGDIGGQAQSNSGGSDFMNNPYFVKSIDPEDYKELQRVQKMEAETQGYVSTYMKNYEKVKSLYDRYIVAETEADAEAVYAELEAAMDDNIVLERRLAKAWSEIFDQKSYVYSYFLEKENREDLLDLTENMMTKSLQEKLAASEYYASDAVANYCLQKPIILNYEMYVAKLLNQTAAIDSLTNVSKAVRQIDFRIPKIDVERRSFVDYQAIEFTPKSIYNASNPIPDCVVYEYGTIYRILLGNYKYKQSVSIFRNASPLFVEEGEDGRFSYYVGGLRTRAEAEAALEVLKKKGFRNPQIIEWCDGRKTNLSEQDESAQTSFRVVIKGGTLDDTVRDVIATMAEGCAISKVSEDTFIVGLFDSRAMAERVAQAVVKCDESLTTEITEISTAPAGEEAAAQE